MADEQIKELTAERDQLKHDLGNEQGKVVGLTHQRDELRGRLAKMSEQAFTAGKAYGTLMLENEQLREALAKCTATTQHTAAEFAFELERARKKFPPMASAHEGYAVILEELDELWDIVKQKQTERDYVALRKETVQLGAMVLGFLTEIVDANNRR